MQFPARKSVAILTLYAFTTMAGGGQQQIQISKRASLVKEKVARLTAGDKISVVRNHAAEEYGTFKSADKENFTFYDVDHKNDVTLRYADVKKVKDGYGGYNYARQRHTDQTKARIIIGVTVGVLAALIVAAATAKN